MGTTTDATAADRTLRPGNEKTLRPVTGKTQAPAVDKTMKAGHESTLSPDRDEVERIVHRHASEFILQGGQRYRVKRVLSQHTGEAQIYLVENKRKYFVLKLYYAAIQPPPDYTVMEVVRRAASSGYLVPTLEYGQWTDPQSREIRIYELMDYCAGGSLDSLHTVGDEKLLGDIALKCGAAMHYLHRQGIIHRDVKPANFFFGKPGHHIDDLLLGDFGIAVQCDHTGIANVDFQLRTKIYAAPEYYFSVDGKIQINTKSDFYALGMMLLTLWNGEELFRINEYELINLKRNAKLPYPKDMPERLLQLVKALTLADPNMRAGFPEIERWARGENIYDLREEKDARRPFTILFNASKKQSANSVEELVRFMMDDKALAVKYLYSGKVSKWLTDNLRPELAIQVETIVERQYPKDQDAGLMASCYLLDPQLPYYDISGAPMAGSREIALSLITNAEYYAKELANKNNALFLFFNSHGAGDLVTHFTPLFKKGKDNSDVLYQLVYALAPQLPWVIVDTEDHSHSCQTPDDILQVIYTHEPDDYSWERLSGEAFLTWLSHRDKALEGKIRQQQDCGRSCWCVLYNLSPRLSYTLQMDEQADDYFFTAKDMGRYMSLMMTAYCSHEEGAPEAAFAAQQLEMLTNIDGSRLYYYLKSKGVYDDKIDWIRYCAETESKDNSAKAGPYDWIIGVYKAIKGLGFNPYYYFTESDKYVQGPEGLSDIPLKELKAELNKDKSTLNSWLTVFFQEDPALDLAEKYSYEKATVRYMEYMKGIDPTYPDVLNYFRTANAVQSARAKLQQQLRFNVWSKIIFGGLLLLITAVVIAGLLNFTMPFKEIISGWVFFLSLGIGAWTGYRRWCSGNNGFFVSVLIAVGLFVASYFLIRFALAGLNYLMAGLLLAGAIWVLINCYIKHPVAIRSHGDLLHPGFEELCLEPLYFTFHGTPGSSFKSSIGARSKNYGRHLQQGTKKLYLRGGLLLLAALICGALITYFSPAFGLEGAKMLEEKQRYESLEGTWNGLFEDREARLYILKSTKDGVEAHIQVHYKNQASESLDGTINLKERTFHFDDRFPDNGMLDGEYSGTINEAMNGLEGTYQNYKTKKQVKFQFTIQNELSELQ